MHGLVHAVLLLAHTIMPAATLREHDHAVVSVAGSASAPHVVAADSWTGSDKFQHFWASYAVTTFAFAAAGSAGVERRSALWAGVAASAVAGMGKEALDRRSGGFVSMRDLVADALGTAAAYFLLRQVR